MPKKPFTIVAERLGEILELCREMTGKKMPPRVAHDTMIASVSESTSPVAKREYVRVPQDVSVGDVVAYDGRLGVKGIQGIGVVVELVDPATVFDCRAPGEAYAVWKGPMIPYVH